MMMEEHVHCADCLRAIATKETRADGTVVDVEVAVGQMLTFTELGNGEIGARPRPVPLCPSCAARIKQQSKLIVPEAVVAKN